MVLDLSQNKKEEKKAFSFEKTEEIAILSKNGRGWTVELNKVSYNDGDPVYDLRSWSPEGKMGKGMTLTDQTLANLLIVLKAHLKGELPTDETETPSEEEISAHLPDDF